MDLTDSDRADIVRIVIKQQSSHSRDLAKHFIAVGLERAAMRCEQFADATRADASASV